ncbi:MAG: BatA and WFA domain-containing protein [Balneolaceae bacterium]|nr:BatA and WFA domain-containing protein [Balneolaceae bacterium]MBO6544831.1 BatA and WFA domain-containing protein [Balneolaceae bacterium]MBO6646227.1 BatA and WFA domain-containing protein [Balneolaceae bacterium]
MSFLSPLFLIAVSAIGLPLIIHLLNLRRPQRVEFSTLAFFKELQKTTIRKIRIKRYLLLLLRLLAIACLALVLARPFLPPGLSGSANSQAPALNAILIDNSISMSRIGDKGPLIEQAKSIVKSIEASSKEDDRFILQVTNGAAQYSTIVGHNQLLRRIEEIDVISSGNYTTDRIENLYGVLSEAPYQNKRLFILGDGQSSQFNGEFPETDDRSITTSYINLGEVNVQNTVVTNLESSTNMIGASLPVNLTVTVENKGEVPIANQFVSLEFSGSLVGQYSLSMEANSSRTFSFEVVPQKVGSSNGKVIIEGDEFTQDNEYFFTVQVPETRRILWVKEETPAIASLESYTGVVLEASGNNDAQLSYEESGVEILGTNEISGYDAIILDGIKTIPEFAFNNLLEFVQGGRGLVFYPSESGDIRNYNSFLRQFNVGEFEGIMGEYASFNSVAKGNEVQEDHPIFAGLFERDENEDLRIADPDVYYYYKLKPSSSPGGFNILTLNTGDPLIRDKRFGEGKLIISSIGNSPGWSNFAVKPLYAPLYYRALLYAASSDEGGFATHQLGETFSWSGDVDAENVSIRVDEETVIPDARVAAMGAQLTYPAEAWRPGWVTISDENREYSVAVNLERNESDFASRNIESILEDIAYVDASDLGDESLEAEIKASGFGREIWSWFMLAGLLFLVIESLLSVLYKAEKIT